MMETALLQGSDQKRMDELRRINGSLDHGESTLSESKEATVLKRTKALKVSRKVNMHKFLDLITAEK
jgi:hypothetical protein